VGPVAQTARPVKGPTPRRLKQFVRQRLGLASYLKAPGDGRLYPQIPAGYLLWAQLVCYVLRAWAFHAMESLVNLAPFALGLGHGFGNDALGYFTERMDPATTRTALISVLRHTKRNKGFEGSRWIGFALDGTTVGHCTKKGCSLCRPHFDKKHCIRGYNHALSMIAVVGTALSLPFDVEPYGPGDSEYAASQRLLSRAVASLGRRFADYVVADGAYATAPFLHTASDLGLRVVARLKGNLPELFAQAKTRLASQPPTAIFEEDGERVELWDADDFDPWDALCWPTVRVLRYRQQKSNGTVIEAYWLTNFTVHQVNSQGLYRIAKSRWEIENQGFNDTKNRYGLKHIAHHHENSLLMGWLLICLAVTIERLYRLRFLHRGVHPIYTAIELVRRLWFNMGRVSWGYNTS